MQNPPAGKELKFRLFEWHTGRRLDQQGRDLNLHTKERRHWADLSGSEQAGYCWVTVWGSWVFQGWLVPGWARDFHTDQWREADGSNHQALLPTILTLQSSVFWVKHFKGTTQHQFLFFFLPDKQKYQHGRFQARWGSKQDQASRAGLESTGELQRNNNFLAGR